MEEQDLVESSDTDMRDKKVGYKINRKMEKSIAKDEADMKKVRVPLTISSLPTRSSGGMSAGFPNINNCPFKKNQNKHNTTSQCCI